MRTVTPPQKFDGKRWIREYMRDLENRIWREHVQRGTQELVASFRKLRRAEEELTISADEFRWQCRDRSKPLTLVDAQRRQNQVTERNNIIRPGDQKRVAAFIRHADQLARTYRTDVLEIALPGTNAYAFPRLNQIEAPPIVSGATYFVRVHEQAHVANPCQPTHKRVPTHADPKKTLCVRCELVAWQWSIDHAIEFDREMHARLAQSLITYERYAVGAERDELRRMCSPLGYCEARQRRAMRTH